jgi:LacI family transcriptional regulator
VAATLADVARAAGVHPGTASKALNPDTQWRVSAGTVRRVVAAAEKLGYQPNAFARALRTRRSHLAGVIVPDLTNPLFPPIVRGIEKALGQAGYTAVIANSDNDPERERSLFAALRARQADGFILATARRQDPLVDAAVAEGVPMVLVNRLTDRRAVPAVAPDEAAGIAAAVDHLTGLGHRRIGHISGPQELSTGYLRYRAFLEAVDRHGLDPGRCPVVFADAYSDEAGRAASRELFAADPAVTAVLAANDLLALGCLDTLVAAGRSCPADVSVVGFNDMPMISRLAPPLTTVHVPQREIGEAAARLLLQQLEEPVNLRPSSLLLGCDLVVRGSTAPPHRR